MYVCSATEEQSVEMNFRLPNCTVNPTGNILGFGSYGKVVEVEYRGNVFAAKKYRHVEVGNLISILGQELHILSSLSHRNIVQYYGLCTLAGDKATVIVMEKMDMNLSTFFEENVDVTLVQKFKILHDVAEGLNHLHTRKPGIIHRDLTATNVLLNSRHVAKIGDFGNSRMVDLSVTPELLISNPGTLDYMPPEAQGHKYNEKLDIFSFGHLSIYTLIQHRPHPLLRHTYRERGKFIPRTEVERRHKYTLEVISKLGGEEHSFFKIIIQCLQDEPDNRPSCFEILEVLATHNIIKAIVLL